MLILAYLASRVCANSSANVCAHAIRAVAAGLGFQEDDVEVMSAKPWAKHVQAAEKKYSLCLFSSYVLLSRFGLTFWAVITGSQISEPNPRF